MHSFSSPWITSSAPPAGATSAPRTPAEALLEQFRLARSRGDLEASRRACKALLEGWSHQPVWRRGRNSLRHQRARLSPYVRYVGAEQAQGYYQAYLSAVMDPEYRRLESAQARYAA